MEKSSSDCDFCCISDCYLGVQRLKGSEKCLNEILEEENDGGVGSKKNKQKIGHKLMCHYDSELVKTFNLGTGFKHEKFNNLALDKIRKDKDGANDIGNEKVFKASSSPFII